jgi:hypothetical protein
MQAGKKRVSEPMNEDNAMTHLGVAFREVREHTTHRVHQVWKGKRLPLDSKSDPSRMSHTGIICALVDSMDGA